MKRNRVDDNKNILTREDKKYIQIWRSSNQLIDTLKKDKGEN